MLKCFRLISLTVQPKNFQWLHQWFHLQDHFLVSTASVPARTVLFWSEYFQRIRFALRIIQPTKNPFGWISQQNTLTEPSDSVRVSAMEYHGMPLISWHFHFPFQFVNCNIVMEFALSFSVHCPSESERIWFSTLTYLVRHIASICIVHRTSHRIATIETKMRLNWCCCCFC